MLKWFLVLSSLQALKVQRATEKVAIAKLKELAYIRQEIKNPLCGITFTRQLLEDTDLSDDQKQFLDTSAVCEQQLHKVLNDMDLESIEDGYVSMMHAACGLLCMSMLQSATFHHNLIEPRRGKPRVLPTFSL